MSTPNDVNSSGHGGTIALQSCPSRDEWLHALSNRDTGALEQRPDLQAHLEQCAACRATTTEVRRFQHLLLRGKPSGLTPAQRASLEERVRMMSGHWEQPTRPWLVWGTALAAATGLAVLAMQPFETKQHPSVDDGARTAAVAAVEQQVAIGAVEGEVEVAGRDGQWSRLHAGAFLHTGARLRTIRGGHLTVPGRFDLRLGAGTEGEVLTLQEQTAFVRVRQGDVDCQVNKLRPGHRFAVMFGGFRASVVGTRFTVHQQAAGGGGQVTVTEGAVRVDAADDPAAPLGETTTVVHAGQQWRHVGGVMSLEPIPQANLPAVQVQVEARPTAPTGQGQIEVQVHKPAGEHPAQPHETSSGIGHHKASNKGKGNAGSGKQILIEVPHQTMPQP